MRGSENTAPAAYTRRGIHGTGHGFGSFQIPLIIQVPPPGSTGGGIKTTTLFALCLSAKSASDGKGPNAFRRRLPASAAGKAFTVTLIAFLFLLIATFLLCCFEPDKDFMDLFFEAVSAFATVGLSITGTATLGTGARIVLIITMFIGRIGPLTAATLLHDQENAAWSYSEEGLTIG